MFASPVSLYCTLPTARISRLIFLRSTGAVSTLAIARACSDSSSIESEAAAAWVFVLVMAGLADGVARINGIEQIGHLPGLGNRTCGCIEHVQICPLASVTPSVPLSNHRVKNNTAPLATTTTARAMRIFLLVKTF